MPSFRVPPFRVPRLRVARLHVARFRVPRPGGGAGRLRRPRTLRSRLALVALATTTLWVALLTFGFNLGLAAILHQQADDLLRTRASAVAATVEVRPDGEIKVHEPGDDVALDIGIWIYRGGTALERPVASDTLQNQADALAGKGRHFADASMPQPTRLYALPLTVRAAGGGRGPQVGTIVASTGLAPYRITSRSALAVSLGLALMLVGGVYFLTRTIIGRALRPVSAMSAQASRWSRHGTTQRFGSQGRPAELATLAAGLDQLLDREAAVLRREQQLTAELSHELRNPLARITAETDWLTARPRTAEQLRESHEAIAAAAAQMQHICGTLLSQARDAHPEQAPGDCVPRDVAQALADSIRVTHPQAPPVTVTGDWAPAGVTPELLQRILAPLLDNARRYAQRSITVACARTPEGVRVTVSDDGPGVPEGTGDAVFEAGRRLRPDDGHDGAGLGLPLARRLAHTAGGDLTLRPSAAGAEFRLTLPPG